MTITLTTESKISEITYKAYNVATINLIASRYPTLRQNSKAPTFALTYGGTYRTLIKNCGISKQVALDIEANYHSLYVTSDRWVANKIKQAGVNGYATACFGLKIRAPLLKICTLGNRSTPYEAEAEARTIGNAVSGQSYSMLNNRALNEFMQRVHSSKYRLKIKPCALIHDALYFIIKDELEVIEWFNNNLIECMQWQDLPELQHDQVKLGAEVDLHFGSWAKPITIPNKSTQAEIIIAVDKGIKKYDLKNLEDKN